MITYMPARKARGLTLLEVLIVMSVVSIGMLGAMSVFYWGLRAGSEGAQMTEAINYSRDILEAIRVRNLSFVGSAITTDTDLLGSHPLDFAPFTDLNLPPPDKTPFHREVSITRLGPSGYEYRIALISVSTVWDIKGRTKRVTVEGYAAVQ